MAEHTGAVASTPGIETVARLFGRERAEQIAVLTEYTWHTDADRDPFAAYLDRAMNEVAPSS